MNAISQGSPVLSITTRAAKVNIRQRRPKLTIRHQKSKMRIRRKAPVFRINRSVSNIKIKKIPIVQISKRFVRGPVIAASKYSEKFLLDDNKLNIYDDSLNNTEMMMSEPIEIVIPENNTKTISLETMNLEWDNGYFEIDWTQSAMEIDWNMDILPEIQVEPHEVEIHVRNNIKRNFKIKKLKDSIGAKLDKSV